MTLFEGTYKLKKRWYGGYGSDYSCWDCTLSFDELEITASAKTRKGSLRRANRAMSKAVKLRSSIRSVKGLCDDNNSQSEEI